MRTSVVYRRCMQIRDAMGKDGWFTANEIKWNDIEHYVALYCGADPRTLEKYRHYITYFGFFKENRKGIFVWSEMDSFGNPVKEIQTNMSLLRVLRKTKTPKRNY